MAAPLAKFLSSIGREASHAIVAGNSAGVRVGAWQQALITVLPNIDVQCHVAPLRKQSADVRLMFELARVYHGDPDPSTLILVLSRDDLLLAATVRRCRKTGQLDKLRPTGQLRRETWV